jgi:hypothetical protein
MDEITEDLFSKIGSERDRQYLLDREKRDIFLYNVLTYIKQLNENNNINNQNLNNFNAIQKEILLNNVNSMISTDENKINYNKIHDFFLDKLDFITTKKDKLKTVKEETTFKKIISAVFDGNERYECDFNIDTNNIINNSNHENKCNYDNSIVIGSNCEVNNTNYVPTNIELSTFDKINDSKLIYLSDRCLNSKDSTTNDEISEIILTDQSSYSLLINSVQTKLNNLLNFTNLYDISKENLSTLNKWKFIEDSYLKQQNWSKISKSLIKGMKDQHPDFNKNFFDDLPASWNLNVTGRVNKDDDDDDDDDDDEDDSVCMCCFDGTSADDNIILFCDGCNSPLHQACYGIANIPDDKFYCDRCIEIKEMVVELNELFDIDNARNYIKCCLCPLYHGGLKPTTDGRWVHICCALWANESTTVVDVTTMSPVDVSDMTVQVPIYPIQLDAQLEDKIKLAEKILSSPNGLITDRNMMDVSPSQVKSSLPDVSTLNKDIKHTSYVQSMPLNDSVKSSPISSVDVITTSEDNDDLPCMFCNIYGGYVIKCNHQSCKDTEQCKSTFHPICAWFNGISLESTITDKSYKGLERNGIYPSGLNFKFKCNNHCSDLELLLRQKQMSIRNKYKILEDNLDQIPGLKRKKRRNKIIREKIIKEKKVVEHRDRSVFKPIIERLEPDIYDETLCSVCLECIDSNSNSISAPLFGDTTSINDNIDFNDTTNNNIKKDYGDYSMDVISDTNTLLSPDKEDLNNNSNSDINNDQMKSEFDIDRYKFDRIVTCSQCNIAMHKFCHDKLKWTCNISENGDWKCDYCLNSSFEDKNLNCNLCPRRGGCYKQKTNFDWIHIYCAQNISSLYCKEIDDSKIKLIYSKYSVELKISKCIICDKNNGLCMKCSHDDCKTLFHPICAQLNGQAYIHMNGLSSKQYCIEHVPDGVKFINGRWVNGREICNIREALLKTRNVFDSICQREEIKVVIQNTEREMFSREFNRILDKAKGRKRIVYSDVIDDGIELTSRKRSRSGSINGNFNEMIEDDYGINKDENNNYNRNNNNNNNYYYNQTVKEEADDDEEVDKDDDDNDNDDSFEQNDLNITLNNGNNVLISKTFLRKNKINIPKIVNVEFAGAVITKEDTCSTNRYNFLTNLIFQLKQQLMDTRTFCGVFNDNFQAKNFIRDLDLHIKNHLELPYNKFIDNMKLSNIHVDFSNILLPEFLLKSSNSNKNKENLIQSMYNNYNNNNELTDKEIIKLNKKITTTINANFESKQIKYKIREYDEGMMRWGDTLEVEDDQLKKKKLKK